MNNDNEMYTKMSLKDWISDKCMMWRDHYQSNYQEKHDEYYRI